MTEKVLRLYNTFTRTLKNVEIEGKLISPSKSHQPTINGSFYICGPTVYDDCHVGHALTYIRADLFRRFMKSIFNVRLSTVMNITDIDDKILKKSLELEKLNNYNPTNSFTDPNKHPFHKVSDKYYRNFLKDLNTINVLPADIYVRISRHIDLITNFIRKLERNGNAYIASNGDVHFRVNSLKNYVGRSDNRFLEIDNIEKTSSDINSENISALSKEDRRDFVLWKLSKPNEPIWIYKSSVFKDKLIPGRPGWHVQCSAISSAIFGKKLDFHFGGKDLIFPHHYNEQACCCAYHQLDTSNSLNVWTDNWLHSGHLVLKESSEKMSKSLGNVVAIKNFIGRSSVNALRLLCITSHYRSDVTYNDDLIDKLKSLDHRINAFYSYLIEELRIRQESLANAAQTEDNFENNSLASPDKEIELYIKMTRDSIVDGICDDFHLDRGLNSIIDLSKVVYGKSVKEIKTRYLIIIWSLLSEWCSTSGLSYGVSKTTTHMSNSLTGVRSGDTSSSIESSNCATAEDSLDLLSEFRNKVRVWILNELKRNKNSDFEKSSLDTLMKECDNIRAKLNELGYVARDSKS